MKRQGCCLGKDFQYVLQAEGSRFQKLSNDVFGLLSHCALGRNDGSERSEWGTFSQAKSSVE